MKALININGEIVHPEDAKISVFDRGFLYGDSIYETTLTYDGIPFKLKEHLERLWLSAKKLNISLRFDKQDIIDEVERTLQQLALKRVYIRITVTRGEGDIGLDPKLAQKCNLIIICKDLPLYPAEWYEKGVHMIVANTLRIPKSSIDPSIKSGNYLNNIMAFTEAKKRGAFDAIMLNHHGFVSECTTSNIWIVLKIGSQKKIITPPTQAGILAGITRMTLIEIAQENGIEIVQENFDTDTLKSASECFITSSTRELVPVVQIDESKVGNGMPGQITQKLHDLYLKHINETINSKKD